MSHFQDLSDSKDLLLQWFLKTKMSFYGENLNLPWWFGLSSWHYAFYGVVLLLIEPSWARKSVYPYRALAFTMIFLQAPLSFTADYVYMTDESIAHVLDRAIAVPAALLELGKLLAYIGNKVPNQVIAFAFLLQIFAVYFFLQSTKAQAAIHRDDFVRWHFLWHCYPLAASSLAVFDFYQREFEVRRLPGIPLSKAID